MQIPGLALPGDRPWTSDFNLLTLISCIRETEIIIVHVSVGYCEDRVTDHGVWHIVAARDMVTVFLWVHSKCQSF